MRFLSNISKSGDFCIIGVYAKFTYLMEMFWNNINAVMKLGATFEIKTCLLVIFNYFYLCIYLHFMWLLLWYIHLLESSIKISLNNYKYFEISSYFGQILIIPPFFIWKYFSLIHVSFNGNDSTFKCYKLFVKTFWNYLKYFKLF